MKVWWDVLESIMRFSSMLIFFWIAVSIAGFLVSVWFVHRLVRIGERFADQAERLTTKLTLSPTPSSDDLRAAASRRVAELEGQSNPFGK